MAKRNREAYTAGLAAGRADRLIGVRSEYAWHGIALDSMHSYSWHYSCGYRDGWTRAFLEG